MTGEDEYFCRKIDACDGTRYDVMYPIIFEFGNFKIYSYGIMVAAGFLISVYFASREAGFIGISSDKILDFGLCSLVFGLIGARVAHVIFEFEYYFNRPLEIILITRGGLSFHGGLAGGIVAGWFYIRRKGMPLWKTADLIIPYLALGEAIGRIGCFLNGCCYGAPTHLPFGIFLPGHFFRLHPTQLYSTLFLFSVFIVLKAIYRKKKYDGQVFFLYLVIYSCGRFFIDFLRGDLDPIFLNLRLSQFISLGIFLVSAILLIKKRNNKR